MIRAGLHSANRKKPTADNGEEARLFAELARQTPPSDVIKGVEFRLGQDSDDYPSVWITLLTSAGDNPTKEEMIELNRVGESLRTAVINSDIDRWPYVEIEPV